MKGFRKRTKKEARTKRKKTWERKKREDKGTRR